ncbi:MAG: glycosyltransferase family 2 protein [Corynebacterium sp.]|uniref:glycosyltransferase n=1 Tax=Corynebacterium sp. TaxID=1720 RepID=UPI0026DDC09E|nr:glycosyltransferase family 2 protein [Corynebacterium sp.]MDO4761367.1 glycosyltransferase family 2 protein [Corynebacterium sp.]
MGAEGFALASLVALAVFIFWVGLVKIAFFPLSVLFELRSCIRRRDRSAWDLSPLVSIIVPCFNEARVLPACVRSVLRSEYEFFELIIVDDGSTDNTKEVMLELGKLDSRIITIHQRNAGKGAALNTGTEYASGEFLMYVDADGVFRPDTIAEMLRAFRHAKVGAVCGDDRPVNVDRTLTTLLALISHVGTGYVRRALAVVNCLPVVSGNIGMFRRSVLQETGLLLTDSLGEDLELTWRVHRAGFQVAFAPRAIVYAESPSTLRGLWRQRVRWARGLIQAVVIHRGMIGNPRYGVFGVFLLFNTLSMLVVPLAQIVVLAGLPFVVFASPDFLPTSVVGWLSFLSVTVAGVLVVYALVLSRAWGDFRHAWTFPLWPIYAMFMGFTLAHALYLELTGARRQWNKLERTGAISVKGLEAVKGAEAVKGGEAIKGADPIVVKRNRSA